MTRPANLGVVEVLAKRPAWQLKQPPLSETLPAAVVAVFDRFDKRDPFRELSGGVFLEVGLWFVIDAHRAEAGRDPLRFDVRLLFEAGEDIFHDAGRHDRPLAVEVTVMHRRQRFEMHGVQNFGPVAGCGQRHARDDRLRGRFLGKGQVQADSGCEGRQGPVQTTHGLLLQFGEATVGATLRGRLTRIGPILYQDVHKSS